MIDYFNHKIKYYNTLNRMIWDDSKYNNATIGNLFSFVKGDKMEIHEIKKILDYTHRDKSWVYTRTCTTQCIGIVTSIPYNVFYGI